MTSSSAFHESFDKKNNELARQKEVEERRQKQVDETVLDAPKYLFRLGREPVNLDLIEYKIIQFLSQKPYKAFRREQIIEAVNSDEHPVTETNLDHYVRSLRGKLGLFSDYIQTVPYIGFRFKP